jgi:hypothetical protein
MRPRLAKNRLAESFGLRFALAYLYAISPGERWMFDEFWRRATESAGGDFASALARRQSPNAALNSICRAAGMERTPELIKLFGLAIRHGSQPMT